MKNKKKDYGPKISPGKDVVSNLIRLEHQGRNNESTLEGYLETESLCLIQCENRERIEENNDLCT